MNKRHDGKKKEGEPCGGQFGDCEAGLECHGICVHGKYFLGYQITLRIIS